MEKLSPLNLTLTSHLLTDATTYAHFLFNAFDIDRNGSIRFEDFVIGLSVLLRGSVTEKLNWAFNLYDINKDGYITKEVCMYELWDTWKLDTLRQETSFNTCGCSQLLCVQEHTYKTPHISPWSHLGSFHLFRPVCLVRLGEVTICSKGLQGELNQGQLILSNLCHMRQWRHLQNLEKFCILHYNLYYLHDIQANVMLSLWLVVLLYSLEMPCLI